MKSQLPAILACPRCHGALQPTGDALECGGCFQTFAVRDQVPIFLSDPIATVPVDHTSNSIGPEYEKILREGKSFVLNIGGGATKGPFPNCIELEHQIFCNTDVVGDAHSLPFRDAVFDCVFAFNVFEHLRDPQSAASEIFRVLKPNGLVAIQTAFLQPLHDAPNHFYNATEYGVREWFTQFHIERCDVSGNFSPAYMLAFLSSHVLEAVRLSDVSPDDQNAVAQASLADWARFWSDRTQLPPGFHALQTLPRFLQKRIAAGFELQARKPAANPTP